jgi:hypothetical protein
LEQQHTRSLALHCDKHITPLLTAAQLVLCLSCAQVAPDNVVQLSELDDDDDTTIGAAVESSSSSGSDASSSSSSSSGDTLQDRMNEMNESDTPATNFDDDEDLL